MICGDVAEQSGRQVWPNYDENEKGIECPRCGCRHLLVDTTRRSSGQITRYRMCRWCGHRIVTYEKVREETK
jgi:DNA-directed RNA polymerase subunit RPC12/RpoP